MNELIWIEIALCAGIGVCHLGLALCLLLRAIGLGH